MMDECPVCYCEQANCKLVCGHSFCRSCVKKWYYNTSDTQACCPMCRKRLYFKGMYKVLDKWEEERVELQGQEVFNQMFDELLEDVSDSSEDWEDDDWDSEDWDSEEEEDWEDFCPPVFEDERMSDLRDLQERFRLIQQSGFTMSPELLSDYWCEVCCYTTAAFGRARPEVASNKRRQQIARLSAGTN
jgi:hypothetical protein